MHSNTKLIVISLVASLVIIGGAVAILGQEKSVKREEQGTASLSLDKTAADLGSMKTQDERSAVFTLTNTAQTTLRIWNVKTSCDCTFAKIKIGEKTSGEFSMHAGGSLANWMGEVPPGGRAELIVIYRPYIMPVVGKVARQVTFDTNDPQNSKVQVEIGANVE